MQQGLAAGEAVPPEFVDLVKPHVQSFDYFLGDGLNRVVELLEPIEVHCSGVTNTPRKFFNVLSDDEILSTSAMQIVHTVTKQVHRVWFESPAIGRPLRDDSAGRQERLFPRDCRESVLPNNCSCVFHTLSCKAEVCAAGLSHCLTCYDGVQGSTYAAALHMDLCFQLEGVGVQRLNRRLGMVPIMVKSDRCYLRHLTR